MRNKVKAIQTHLNDTLLERSREIDQILAAIFSGQHIFMLGVPGTAKSFLARQVFECFKGAESFEKLLSKTAKPQELFGPVSLSALKDDKLRFNTQGFLAHAHFAFLDEIFKANSSTLNNLLTIMEERVFHNGDQTVESPLKTVISASNELPQDDILQALYDRFSVRLEVKPLKSRQSFKKMVAGETKTEPLDDKFKIGLDELDQIQAEVEAIDTSEVQDALFDLKNEIVQASSGTVFVSDRHFKKALQFLKGMLWVKGADRANKDDCLLLENALWSAPEDRPLILSAIQTQMSQTTSRAQNLFNEIESMTRTALDTEDAYEFIDMYGAVSDKYSELQDYADEQAGGDYGPSVSDILDRADSAMVELRDVYRKKRRAMRR